MKKAYFITLTIAIFIAGLIASHIYVKYQGLNYSGFPLIFDHLYNLVLVISLLFICTSFGLRLLSLWRHLLAEPLEILIISLVMGIGSVSTMILFIGFISLLKPAVIGFVLLFVALLAHKSVKECLILIRDSGVYVRKNCSLFTLLFLGTVTFFLLVLASSPPADWDTLVYHVQVPALFLKANKIFLPTDNLNTSSVQLIHMLYIPLLAFGNASAPGLFSALLGLLLGLAIFEFSNRFSNNFVGGICLSLIWASTVILIVSITPRVDVTVALFCFIAHYLLIKSHVTSSSVFFYLSAILLGFAFGVKYNAGLYIISLSPLILWAAYSKSDSFFKSFRKLLLFSFLIFCATSPWLLKNWILLESPVYPFFTARQYPSWTNDLIKPLFMIDPKVYQASFQIPAFFNLKDFFFNPGRLSIEPEGVFYFPNLLFLFLPLIIDEIVKSQRAKIGSKISLGGNWGINRFN